MSNLLPFDRFEKFLVRNRLLHGCQFCTHGRFVFREGETTPKSLHATVVCLKGVQPTGKWLVRPYWAFIEAMFERAVECDAQEMGPPTFYVLREKSRSDTPCGSGS